MTDLLAIGTRKGLWLARSDDDRRTWTVDGPHLLAQEVAAVSIDTRPAGAAGARRHPVRPLGPDRHVVRRPRGARGRRPTTARSASPRTPVRRWPASGSCGPTPPTGPASSGPGCEPHSLWRSTDGGCSFELVRGPARPPAPPDLGARRRGRGGAHRAARPGVGPGDDRHEHRRRLRQRGRRREVGAPQPRHHRRPSGPTRCPSTGSACTRSPSTRAAPTGCTRRTTSASSAATTPGSRGRRSPAGCPPTSASRSSPRPPRPARRGWCRWSPTCSGCRRTAGCACTAPATPGETWTELGDGPARRRLDGGAARRVLRRRGRPHRHLRGHPRRLRLRQRRRGRHASPWSPTTCPTSSRSARRAAVSGLTVSVQVLLPGVLADLAGGVQAPRRRAGGRHPRRPARRARRRAPDARPADPRRDGPGAAVRQRLRRRRRRPLRGRARDEGPRRRRGAGAAVGRRRLRSADPGRRERLGRAPQSAARVAQFSQSCWSS